jgi:UPF0755 protein
VAYKNNNSDDISATASQLETQSDSQGKQGKSNNEYNVSDEKIDEFFSMVNESPLEDEEETAEEKKRKLRIFKGKKRNREEEKNGGLISGVAKAIIYIVVVLIISTFLSYFIITAGNDVFALVKTQTPDTFTITSEDDYSSVAEKLKTAGAVDYDWLFKMFIIFQVDNTDEIDFIEGEYSLEAGLNYTQIFTKLTVEPFVQTEIQITVPEGYTTDQIIEMLVSKNIASKDELIHAINNYPFKHEFVQQLEEFGYSKDRKYRLEGYLYPDTYYFYENSDPVQVINKFLNNFDTKFWDEYEYTYKEYCEKHGLTFDEIITLSSIVQMEGITLLDFENISMVFHNRMKSNSYPKLESCATIQYFLEERKDIITDADTKIDNPYNTYMYDGLPPGAICNPGINAIESALFPAFDPEMLKENNIKTAYFFVSDLAGNIYYAATERGHEANKAKVKKINEQIQNGEYNPEE